MLVSTLMWCRRQRRRQITTLTARHTHTRTRVATFDCAGAAHIGAGNSADPVVISGAVRNGFTGDPARRVCSDSAGGINGTCCIAGPVVGASAMLPPCWMVEPPIDADCHAVAAACVSVRHHVVEPAAGNKKHLPRRNVRQQRVGRYLSVTAQRSRAASGSDGARDNW